MKTATDPTISKFLYDWTKMRLTINSCFGTRALSQYKDRLFQEWGFPILKIRRLRDRLIFNMGIPILVRHLYIWDGPQGISSHSADYAPICFQWCMCYCNLGGSRMVTRHIYRKTSDISCTLVGNKVVDHSDVVGASPVGAAPTTSSFST